MVRIGKVSLAKSADRTRLDRNYRLLSQCGLFSEEFYLSQVRKSGIGDKISDALAHYIERGDAMRISPHPLINVLYYHKANPDVEADGQTALQHFVLHGCREGRNPHPLFDVHYVKAQIVGDQNPILAYLEAFPGSIKPHPLFDEEYVHSQLVELGKFDGNVLTSYLKITDYSVNPNRNFDAGEYVRLWPESVEMGPLCHYILVGKSEGKSPPSTHVSLKNVAPQIEKAAKIDWDILKPDTAVENLRRYRSIETSPESADLVAQLISKCLVDECDIAIFIPHFIAGGAEKVLAQFLKAAISIRKLKIVIFVTDSDHSTTLNWLPNTDDMRIVEIYHLISKIELTQSALAIANFLQLLRPKNLLIMNSFIGWDLVERYGTALSQFSKIHSFAFCYDYDIYGRKAGYARTHLPVVWGRMSTVICDNTKMVSQFAKDMFLNRAEAANFFVLKQPIRVNTAISSANINLSKIDFRYKRKTILWAGRFHRQKNILCALEIARQMQNANFIIAGDFEDHPLLSGALITPNVHFFGPYSGFESLPIRDCNLFLHTADWDGLPNVLLEAASMGLPIVARDVGGVSDIINEETGWLLPPDSNAGDFRLKIEEAFAFPDQTNDKVRNLTKLICEEHSWAKFTDDVAKILGRFN